MIDFGFFLQDIRGNSWPRVIRIILTFTTFILLLHPRLLLPSPCHDQDNSFFISLLRSYVIINRKIINLVTTFTTPPPQSKNVFFFSFSHYVNSTMIKRKTFFSISALRSIRHGYTKRNVILLNHYFDYATIMKKGFFFHFTGTFTMEISSYMILLRSLHHQPVEKIPKWYVPRKKYV